VGGDHEIEKKIERRDGPGIWARLASHGEVLALGKGVYLLGEKNRASRDYGDIPGGIPFSKKDETLDIV